MAQWDASALAEQSSVTRGAVDGLWLVRQPGCATTVTRGSGFSRACRGRAEMMLEGLVLAAWRRTPGVGWCVAL